MSLEIYHAWRNLPPDAQDRLFDNITALSASGSQLATEHLSDPEAFSEESVQRISERWRRAGFDLDAADLFYQGERSVVPTTSPVTAGR